MLTPSVSVVSQRALRSQVPLLDKTSSASSQPSLPETSKEVVEKVEGTVRYFHLLMHPKFENTTGSLRNPSSQCASKYLLRFQASHTPTQTASPRGYRRSRGFSLCWLPLPKPSLSYLPSPVTGHI